MKTTNNLKTNLFDLLMIALAVTMGWYTWKTGMGTAIFDRSRLYAGVLALTWVVVPTLLIVRSRFVRATP